MVKRLGPYFAIDLSGNIHLLYRVTASVNELAGRNESQTLRIETEKGNEVQIVSQNVYTIVGTNTILRTSTPGLS